MSDLIPLGRTGRGLDRASRELTRRVDEAHGDAVVAAARVEGAAFVTSLALAHAGQLTMQEHRVYRFAPTGEHRYAQIVEAFSAVAAAELLGLSMQNRRRS